jgi:5'-3' exonuclease
LEKGTLRKLTYNDKDISYIYYNLRDIEGARQKYTKLGYDVVVHVCMDSKTKRKEERDTYKANRENKLSEENFSDMEITANLLREAGYDVIKVEGYEADDIIWTLTREIPSGEYIVIYTNDSDVTINMQENVVVELYNSVKGTSEVSFNNFEEFMRGKFKSDEFKYNEVMLYKTLVGDKADNVNGITKFGPKAFDKFIVGMKPYMNGFEHCCVNEKYIEALLNKALEVRVLKEEQVAEAKDSLSLVAPRYIENVGLRYMCSTPESREKAYGKYEMVSLYK